MLIVLVSDSHGAAALLLKAEKTLAEAEAIFHLGDVVPDARRIAEWTGKPVYAVRGNCDIWDDEPEERIVTLGGKRFLLCHGHRFRVKQTLTFLGLRAQEAEADAALFGHTHEATVEWSENRLLVNPGALCAGRYATLTVDSRGVTPRLLRV